MNNDEPLSRLRSELQAELTEGILPYWMLRTLDDQHGGFVGAIDSHNVPDWSAPKSAVLNTRILWTFAAAQRVLDDERYAPFAQRAAEYVRERFIDHENGGVYWMLDATGRVLDARKHVYAQAFAIYGLSEHYRASGSRESLADAVALFELLDGHARDDEVGGYREAFSADWRPLEDARLSDVDVNAARSMNSHLHILEAYANLYRAWPDAILAGRLRALIDVILEHIIDVRTGHVHAFFDESWWPMPHDISFGHDIETSWLLLDAADALGDPLLRHRTRAVAIRLAEVVLAEGYDAEHGGIFYALSDDGRLDTDKEWWPQAEAIVGFVNAYEETSQAKFLGAACKTWEFTRRNIVDHDAGEWHRRVTRDGAVRPEHEKVGPWKCPYHNSRACLEMISRLRVPAVILSEPL